MAATAVPARSEIELKRQIGLYAATAITVGNIIGSGIFRSPHSVAQHITSFWLVLLAWVIGGVLSICGSLALAELAVTHPKTGGLYVFIREGFGDACGFVFGWANLWVIKPTVIASITSVFALYFCQVLHLGKGAEFPVGAAAILLLTFVNWLGVKEGARTQSLFTTLKVIGIAALCVAALTLPASHPATAVEAATHAPETSFLQALALAMISILFAYDGWTDSTYVAGEVINPKRVMPIAIVWGTWLVIAVYVLTNIAYFHVLGAGGVAQYEAVGSETIRRLLGEWGARALAVLVAVSTFGTTNGAILTGPRVTQAMAADGLLWKPLARLDARRGTPSLALWVQGVLSCVWLWCASGFEDVSGWFVTTSWLFYALTTASLFVQRRREARGELPTPTYRTPLYPLPAVIFIVATAGIIASDLHDSGWKAWAGVGVAALGFPVYWLWKGRRAKAA
ncbi:MAG: amino acid permease [Candidatus Eisenbacteria bacterium]|uniref:Amino acid permease n=1 Tax=Eiseniibacteriota bacterium TaxID=2212470 RepID=A0A538UA85_UNCEI|nr:MAG: amino acid permease [Candidatus Eisenbacteria bacterium]